MSEGPRPAVEPGEAPDGDDRRTRLAVLAGLEEWIERPMQVLSFVWLGLLVLELTRGLSPLLTTITTVIWALFIAEFALRLALSPDRWRYLGSNWLGAVSLLVPVLRVFRIARAARVVRIAAASRGFRLVRVVGSLNRGMHALGRTMRRRGLGYVLVLTGIVTLAGAAGMYALERELPHGNALDDYASALWWTAMIMTTMGSDYWPRTAEGRVLCLLLSLYAFAVFGYLTASLASYFIGQDAAHDDAELAGRATLEALRADVTALRGEVRALDVTRGRS